MQGHGQCILPAHRYFEAKVRTREGIRWYNLEELDTRLFKGSSDEDEILCRCREVDGSWGTAPFRFSKNFNRGSLLIVMVGLAVGEILFCISGQCKAPGKDAHSS